jgi:hypothetical protein
MSLARTRSWSAAIFGLVLALVLAGSVQAQHPGTGTNAPPPPPGDGTLTVQILHPAGPAKIDGITIALYALGPDGTPGFANGITDANGRFAFTGISTDPGIVYLVGARFQEIPFGKRVTFAAGESQARAEIEVSTPTDRVDRVSIEELRIRLDWMGDRLVVRELVRLVNSGDRVVQTPSSDPGRAIFSRPLETDARDFAPGAGSISDGLALDAGAVRYWGPLYPGEQRVEYQYSLPLPAGDASMRVRAELSKPATRLVVVAGTEGIDVEGAKLIPSREVQSDSGQPLKSWARAGLAAHQSVAFDLTLPASRLDASLVSIPRTDVWLELDDTRLTATVDIQVEVEPGAPVAGTPDAPLLRISIPTNATLQGVAPEAEALGLIPMPDGGFDVIGPIGPGTTSLGYSYRVPARPDGVDLDLRFPRETETLNVLIADTGLAVTSTRLHRLRPFRSGTRNYLHQEAFNISPDETVDLSLRPLRATGLSPNTSIAITIVAAAAAAFFLVTPLRRSTRREVEVDPALVRIHDEREAIYAAIRDLDHDFETGKLEADDHAQMRTGLREQAIALLRVERETAAGETQTAPASASATATPVAPARTTARPAASPDPASFSPSAEPATGGFCPHCGQAVTPAWRFCSHCGGRLNPSAPSDESSA